MPSPDNASVQKQAGFGFMQKIRGFAEDLWKDPDVEFPVKEIRLGGKTLKIPNLLKPLPAHDSSASTTANVEKTVAVAAGIVAPPPKWHALPGEVAEKMWGEGHVLPAGIAVMDLLIAPLNGTKDKNILDLSAGLGSALTHLAAQGCQVKGYDLDAELVVRAKEQMAKTGKAKPIALDVFDPAAFSVPMVHDAIIAREMFYRMADRDKLFYSIGAGVKQQGSVLFTDYIVDPESRSKDAIGTWQAREAGAKPLGLIEMAEAWAKIGFEMRKSEDKTVFYRDEIVKGINRFVSALRAAPPPDSDTKKAILNEVETWVYRLAAIQQGMKFYCFQAFKT